MIGPSHRYYFQGVSAAYFEHYATPCGEIPIDTPYLFALAEKFNIGFVPQAHAKEHSTEVQMPFIKHYFPKSRVIELIYGDIVPEKIASIIRALLHNPKNLVIISSDLSHFYPKSKAENLDRHCIKAVEKLDTTQLHLCEACGITGIEAMLIAAKGYRPKLCVNAKIPTKENEKKEKHEHNYQ